MPKSTATALEFPTDGSASALRRTSAEADFPWLAKTVCYIEVRNGEVRQPGRYIAELREAARRAVAGESQLIAVWPGQWRSDAFLVDTPELLAQAVKA